MRRKNSKLGYEPDKITQWDNENIIGYIPFYRILYNAIATLNEGFNTKSYLVTTGQQKDKSDSVIERNINHENLHKMNIAVKLQLNHSLPKKIFIYSQEKNSKKWNLEDIVEFYESSEHLDFLTEISLIRILTEHFPNFYNGEFFERFENMQRFNREVLDLRLPEARTHLLNTLRRKRNPKKKKMKYKK